ncbi:protein dpy-30 [Angomonas deanei]|uniref:Dpy-30 motif containing protein, putative n=1 Tax=Angomonas deanei TaxID=59799 RepID=A0A7G2CJU3_9TRYP|nr:protein dpy-30 [Angomonas deanei]CAD2219645.1 Dpy-30 motif containing protein, putative [Angomonas deanei]|eukprot:EPY32317.1 protein dpy-30 [Angomonas deanei]
MVHVSDLAEMTRRLLRCPTDELPNPALRYVFAVDGSNLSWSAIVAAINKGFRNTRPTAVVKQDKFPLHNNTELFTLNLTVSNETAEALMSRDDDDVEPVVMSSPIKRHDGSWVSPGGFATNILNVCAEFCAKREVTPLRIAVVGPPQAGKSHLANKLSLHYKIPVFSLEGIVAFYEQGIAELRGKLEDLKQQLLQKETDRRLQIKQKRILKRKRGAGEDRDNSEEDEGAPPHHQSGSEEDEMEERQLALTSEEQQELEGFVEELYEGSSVVANWRSEMAEMERVMLMRQYISSNESSDPNPKKKGAKKKSLKDAQKKKDEEIQQIKETITTAPFQNKAIAIMLRKCLSHAESYNQGFVLDGIPFSVELSRLCFRTGELIPPATEEEALQQFLRPDAIPEKENEPDDSSPPAVEQCEESLLVDYVFTLESGENFLLNRLNANKSNMGADALEDFHARMSIYKKEFFDSPYTVTNFFECAATDPSTSVLCGGRKVSINLIPVDSTEPVSLPPPPQSEYAEIPPSHLETIVYECVGAPHNFGKTPLELHREQVRAKNYNKEQLIRQVNEVKAVQDREKDAFKTESMHRNENSKALSEMKKADQMSLELRSEPLREYLSKSILPLLSKGLIEICETRPEDPVEALAQWLLRNNPSDDIFSDL